MATRQFMLPPEEEGRRWYTKAHLGCRWGVVQKKRRGVKRRKSKTVGRGEAYKTRKLVPCPYAASAYR